MQEVSSPLLVDPANGHHNLTDLLRHRVESAPQHTAFRLPRQGVTGEIIGWQDISTEEFERDVIALAKGLVAAGLAPGDRAAIMAGTCYNWAVTDLAILYAGGTVVPVYETSSPAQVTAILQDAGVQLALAGTTEQADTLAAAFDEAEPGQPAGQKNIWCFAGDQHNLDSLRRLGTGVPDEELELARASAGLDDIATLVYTSGTTAAPKGTKITHRNMLGQVLNVAASYREVVHEKGSTVIFLPLAHVLARGLQFVCLSSGMSVAHLANPAQLIGQLSILRPTFLVVVPRVLEKIQQNIALEAGNKKLGALWSLAERTAVDMGRHLEDVDLGRRSRAGAPLRLQHRIFDGIFYQRVRTLLGGRIEWLLSGGAPLPAELSLLFRGMGIPAIEGYGLTETTAPVAGNLPGKVRSGTVGEPIAGATIRTNDAGEVSVRGVGVFEGYTDSELTSAAFDSDGFFATGDLGEFEGRHLVLKGRVKDVLVTSSGKTVYPFTWENFMESFPLVAHAVIVGEGRKYLTALIVPDIESARGLDLQQIGWAVQTLVNRANSLVSTAEKVKKFELVEANLTDPDLITPTQKLKRAAFATRWADTIEGMYS